MSCVRACVRACRSLGSIDGTVRCWDTRSRKFDPIQILDEAQDGVSSLKVSEHELLTGSVPSLNLSVYFSFILIEESSKYLFYLVSFSRSVDGRVRRYDLRMGQLHVDFINSQYLVLPTSCCTITNFCT